MARGKKKMFEEKFKRRRQQKKESMRRARAKHRQDPDKHEQARAKLRHDPDSIAQGQDITGQEEFVTQLKGRCPGINIIAIKDADEEMKTIDNFLTKKQISTFKGTLKVHQITWSKENKNFLEARRLSCTICKPDKKCTHFYLGRIPLSYNNEVSDLNVKVLKNKYVIVSFAGEKSVKRHYVGVITEDNRNTCKVNFLRKSGNKVLKFPQEIDEEVVDKKT